MYSVLKRILIGSPFVVTVIIPEFVLQHWWSGFLHNQSALLLKARLLMRKGTVVTSVPTHID